MKLTNKLFAALLLLSLIITSAAGQSLQPLRERYRSLLVQEWTAGDTLYQALLQLPKEQQVSDQMVQELTNFYPADLTAVDSYLAKVNPDGSFSDINYQDKTRSGWQPKQHAERVLQLCKLYASPSSPFYRQADIAATIHRLMKFWFDTKPKCLNWWQNEIGIPKVMGEAFIIIYDELSAEERQQAIELMRASRIGKTGQNKVWLSQNVLMRGLIEDDAKTVAEARDSIFSEITLSGKEGIQSDWSYQLHGPQQQFGNYGLAFLSSMTFFYKLFNDTPYAMSDAQKQILTNLIDQGYRWVIWHRQMDISSLGRQLYHNVSAQKGLMLAMLAERLGLGGFPADGNNLLGHKHFNVSDYTIHRTPRWMASLKMSSLRTIGSEHVNEDNLYGYYLGDGATYYYGDTGTRNYMDALPVWDWRKTPGTTTLDSPEPHSSPMNVKAERNQSSKVGGIGSGQYGLSAMEYRRDGVRAKKAWIFTPQYVLCLGSDVWTDTTLTVSTTVDQRASRGPLLAFSDGRWQPVSSKKLNGKPRFYHQHVGYILLSDATVRCNRQLRHGSWSTNMRMYEPHEVADTLMSIIIEHGRRPRGGSYQYLVMPYTTQEEVAKFDASAVRVIENSGKMQLVSLPTNGGADYWAAVYEATALPDHIAKGAGLAPGLYHFKANGHSLTIIEKQQF